jgi:hypothetical protein
LQLNRSGAKNRADSNHLGENMTRNAAIVLVFFWT